MFAPPLPPPSRSPLSSHLAMLHDQCLQFVHRQREQRPRMVGGRCRRVEHRAHGRHVGRAPGRLILDGRVCRRRAGRRRRGGRRGAARAARWRRPAAARRGRVARDGRGQRGSAGHSAHRGPAGGWTKVSPGRECANGCAVLPLSFASLHTPRRARRPRGRARVSAAMGALLFNVKDGYLGAARRARWGAPPVSGSRAPTAVAETPSHPSLPPFPQRRSCAATARACCARQTIPPSSSARRSTTSSSTW